MPDTPIGEFGVTVGDVAALVPEASIPTTRGTGQRAVIQTEVEDWIGSLSAALESALGEGWSSLPGERLTQITATGKTVVACAAASYLEVARAPERAGLANTTYADVLWDRWVTGRTELVALVGEWLATDPDLALSRPAATFPAPSVLDVQQW